ncbi:peptide/nickel transport system permease protein [Halalkaliarchaeum desulfuricum]|uniref:Peptide/nickel transport system permease protein n=1 Tax=Halalkaliarchaeum desulfuricum TaxID=2055893 RepID=A0A343TKQ6_9EURY|nr:ABC transporter permease [Halalkaliarchaeum desulfuricum]AUX09678.1 peptide/nickel transport system permease protein [Halalkaliarchaeum desulfuricum]
MNVVRVFLQRIALGLVAAWGVLTAVFVGFTMTDDWVKQGLEGQLRWVGITGEELEARLDAYLADRGLDRPIWEQYLDWMGDMVTLSWGESLVTGEPVMGLVADAVLRTGMYVVPAIVLGLSIGMMVGLYVALNPESRIANGGRGTTYLLFALPSFWIGGMFVSLLEGDVISRSPVLFDHALPIGLATAALLGGYVSYTRAYAIDHASADFVSLVKAKGAGPVLVAKHVVRNAAVPLFSMLFTEALALLVLAVFVIEVLFAIDGFGLLFLEAIQNRDLPVLLGSTIVIIGFGVVGNIIQDLSYSYLDPRVDAGSR